jgi:hypothetical protein
LYFYPTSTKIGIAQKLFVKVSNTKFKKKKLSSSSDADTRSEMDRENRYDIHTIFFMFCKEYLINLTQYPDCLHHVIIESLIKNVSIINIVEI